MAQRRSMLGYGDSAISPASPMTPKGGSQSMYGDPNQDAMGGESKDTFRRRTTPIVGTIEQRPSTLQEIIAMLNGGQ